MEHGANFMQPKADGNGEPVNLLANMEVEGIMNYNSPTGHRW